MTEWEDSEEGIVTVGSAEEAEELLAEGARRRAEKTKRLCNLFKTDDPDFAHALRFQLEKASLEDGKFCETGARHLESIIAGVDPRDPFEAMLAIPMAGIYKALVDQFLRLGLSPGDPVIVSNIGKLTRALTTLMDALERHRSKPGQQVVQHVTVAKGGQAIVGHVHHQRREDDGASPPALTHSTERPMPPLANVPKEVDPVKRGPRK